MSKLLKSRKLLYILVLAAVFLLPLQGTEGFEFRTSYIFQGGSTANINRDLGTGCVAANPMVALNPTVIAEGVNQLAEGWRTDNPDFGSLFTDDYTNLDQLQLTMTSEVPLNSILTILSVQSSSTMGQCIEQIDTGGYDRVSIVTAVARMQIEIEDPSGRKILEGLNEYLFEVREEFR